MYVSLITNKYKQDNNKQYKYLGDGSAWFNKIHFKNELFFENRHIINICYWGNSNKTRLINITPSFKVATEKFKLLNSSDYNKITDYNEIIALQNGDFVIQKMDTNNNKRSLFSGHHEAEGIILPYFYALNLVTKLQFKKISDNNINKNDNVISFFEILGNINSYPIKNKLLLKKTIITIDNNNLSIDNKKDFIRKYNSKFEDKIIMFNNGNFFIFDKQNPDNKFN